MVKVAYILVSVLIISSCGSTKHLQEEEFALIKNFYKINTTDGRINKSLLKTDLKGLLKQKPVKKIWLNPRTWGTPFTLYNEVLTQESASSMQQYLRNRKGFYHAEVNYIEEIRNKKVLVTYDINLGQRYYIKSIELESQDEELAQLFAQHEHERKINIGDPLDASSFDEEERRLVELAQNNGYATFNPNFVEFRGDSSIYEVPVKIFVYNPINEKSHQRYSIGKINVYTEHIASVEPQYQRVDTLQERKFYAKSDKFIVAPSSIEKVMALKEGELYAKKDQLLTNRTLSRLSPYRFVQLDPKKSITSDTTYDFDIYLTPHKHKWAFDMGANLFYSLLNQAPSVASQDLFGFGGNIGWTNRNFKNKAIAHSFGLEGTFEFQIPSFQANTFSIQANNSFRIPHIVDIFKLSPFLNKIGLLTNKSFKNLNLYGSTDVDFSFGVTDIFSAYRLNTVNAAWSFKFQPDEYNRYIWTQIGINVLDTDIDSTFQADILDSNPLLEKSFSDYLFTGFFFRELNIYRQSKTTPRGSYFAFIGDFEVSGLENFLLNRIVNGLSSFDETWVIGGLNFANFVRIESDLRYYKKIRDRSTFAARFNVGIAIPYGDVNGGDDQVVPFVKSYFVGGPNSLRGWQLRELGPGAFSDKIINPVANQPFFQTGDFKIEMNVEYRFDLFWFWEGALFADAGNVWTLRNDEDRKGSQLTGSFLDELAVSVGWGLRADFDYFLLRFDFGYKLRSPFLDPETNSHIIWSKNNLLGNVNFAINYPF